MEGTTGGKSEGGQVRKLTARTSAGAAKAAPVASLWVLGWVEPCGNMGVGNGLEIRRCIAVCQSRCFGVLSFKIGVSPNGLGRGKGSVLLGRNKRQICLALRFFALCCIYISSYGICSDKTSCRTTVQNTRILSEYSCIYRYAFTLTSLLGDAIMTTKLGK